MEESSPVTEETPQDAQAATKKHTEYKRIGAYGLIGIINTGIDFSVLNTLHFRLHWALLASNLVSTSVAMTFSFFANKRFVFNAHHQRGLLRQAMLFWVVTAAGLYGLQSGIIWLSVHVFAGFTTSIAVAIHHIVPLSVTFIVANGVKAAATLASLTWNYILYKRIVFGRAKAG